MLKKFNQIKKLKTLDLSKKQNEKPHEINNAISRVTFDEIVP